MIFSTVEEGEMFGSLRDWRKAVRSPPSYRIGKNTNKSQVKFLLGLAAISLFFIFLFYNSSSDSGGKVLQTYVSYELTERSCPVKWKYNNTYPITQPRSIHDIVQFKIGLVTDLDHSSRSKLESNTWLSYYLHGSLIWNPAAQTVSVTFDKGNFKTLKTKYSYDGRGMELSELVTFDGKLITFDDRGGVVFKIKDSVAHPWLILLDQNDMKGFKCEWATVKDEHLYVGSMGKEWTTPHGEFSSFGPMYVKKISPIGFVETLDWIENYKKIRAKLGIYFPGYLLHESAAWSSIHKKWFFLPRRMSKETYNEETDETQGTNYLITCDENFVNIEAITVGEVIPTHGFSTFKFIPGTNDEVIAAIKTKEHQGKLASYIMVFTIQGKILLGETKIDDYKYEGLEFI